ncbi:MAG: hypothetical protein ACF8MJ_11565 [Phycisphaerales bacterium JB050]
MEDWERVKEIIEACRPLLGDDTLEEVDHYLTHDEWEMAFEGLLIELMRADVVPPTYDFEKWCALLRDLGLDEDSVFDAYLWDKFVAWGKTKRP